MKLLSCRFLPIFIQSPCRLFLAIMAGAAVWLSAGSAQARSDFCAPGQAASPSTEACLLAEQENALDKLDLEDVFLPDLRTLPPHDLQLIVQNGKRIIRFSNSVWNSGPGTLELRGEFVDDNETLNVTQHLFGAGQTLIQQRVGTFYYHAEHTHWHWEGFSNYEIWSTDPEGNLDEMVGFSDKVGYCMLDTTLTTDTAWLTSQSLAGLEIPDRRVYGQCLWKRQGISIGWVDTYASHIPGQSMDVTDLPNGLYALRSTVDPQGYLYEADKSNNSALTYFTLRGNTLNVIEAAEIHVQPVPEDRSRGI